MKVDKIISAIRSGKTLYIQTYLRVIKVDRRALDRFEMAGLAALKDGKDDESGFYIASGKRWDYVMPGGCKVWLE